MRIMGCILGQVEKVVIFLDHMRKGEFPGHREVFGWVHDIGAASRLSTVSGRKELFGLLAEKVSTSGTQPSPHGLAIQHACDSLML